MKFLKQISLIIIFALLCMSIYKDINPRQNKSIESVSSETKDNYLYEIIEYTVRSGDTVLSIVEDINNENINTIEINNIIKDFKYLNPDTNIYGLIPNNTYYFPKYKSNER